MILPAPPLMSASSTPHQVRDPILKTGLFSLNKQKQQSSESCQPFIPDVAINGESIVHNIN